ncbi:leucine-rich repeat protein, partial [Anaerotignum sp.]
TAVWYTDHVANIKTIVIEGGITSIGDYAFSCDGGTKGEYVNLTTLIMADSVTSIGSEAFEDCTALQNITWSENLKVIGSYAFEYAAMTDVVLPDSVTTLYAGAFRCCPNLKSITFSTNLTYIGTGMFYGCTAFSDVYYGGSPSSWEAIDIGISNDDLTNATIHYAEADESAELSLKVSPINIPAGGSASFAEFGLMNTAEFTAGDKLTLTLSDGFSFP